MADIFLSYSSDDRERVIPLVEALTRDGYSVWWDRDIRPGPSFDREIEAAINEAKCIVVLWSASSVDSEWVRNEVEEGVRRGLLVPAVIDDVLPPLAYRRR
ncbi:MAG: toll/interleukin-1 receptor domain-containing protein [Planctomycetota bacterium]|nr:toll/interleukin-1 receptor domain-containing protein [Planctomycetota bacterium]